MQCPVCGNKKSVAVDLHADGYAKELLECRKCGAVWLHRSGEVISLAKEAA